jgi:quercetin 2,3-dioxygenase
MPTLRRVAQTITPQTVIEGAGVQLQRAISPHPSNPFDPFLLFDHAAFEDPLEGPITGFPLHPHRGLETVSYILKGSVRHRDSLGHAGLIGPGAAQWMTAGSGILHEEMPRRDEHGHAAGFQLWVNLPAALKMTKPHYQDLTAEAIPTVHAGGAAVRLLAGSWGGVTGPITGVAAAPTYLDVTLAPGGAFTTTVPTGHTTLAYLFEGAAHFEPDAAEVSAVNLIVYGPGDSLTVTSQPGARFLLLAGAPIGERIVPYGPFVMNTVEEIQTAYRELRQGTFLKTAPLA